MLFHRGRLAHNTQSGVVFCRAASGFVAMGPGVRAPSLNGATMDRVAKARQKGKTAALVVRAAGCRASIEASEIDDVIYWEEGVLRTCLSPGCVGLLSYHESSLQLFPLHAHVSAPKWHLTFARSHWVVVVRVNTQQVGLVVEDLEGWGNIVQSPTFQSAEANKMGLVSVRIGDEALDAELVEVESIVKTDTRGSFFYL